MSNLEDLLQRDTVTGKEFVDTVSDLMLTGGQIDKQLLETVGEVVALCENHLKDLAKDADSFGNSDVQDYIQQRMVGFGLKRVVKNKKGNPPV